MTASVLTPTEIDMSQVAALESRIEQESGRQIHLVVRSLISRDMDRSGIVYITDEERRQRESEAKEESELSQTAVALGSLLSGYPGAQLGDLELRSGGRLMATIETPEEISPSQVAQLQEALVSQCGRKLELVVRSIITRDADAQRYIYAKQDELPAHAPNHMFTQAKMEILLRAALEKKFAGFVLSELSFWEADPVVVHATVRGPRALGPEDASQLEKSLEKDLDNKVRLVLRTQVEALADPSGYLTEFIPPPPQAENRPSLPGATADLGR